MRKRAALYFDVNELPTVLTLEEAAIYLRVSVDCLKKKAQRGEFPAYKLGRTSGWRVDRDDLFAYQRRMREWAWPETARPLDDAKGGCI